MENNDFVLCNRLLCGFIGLPHTFDSNCYHRVNWPDYKLTLECFAAKLRTLYGKTFNDCGKNIYNVMPDANFLAKFIKTK